MLYYACGAMLGFIAMMFGIGLSKRKNSKRWHILTVCAALLLAVCAVLMISGFILLGGVR